jgi:hypothetical protein
LHFTGWVSFVFCPCAASLVSVHDRLETIHHTDKNQKIMKTFIVSMLASIFLFTACTKDRIPGEDSATVTASSSTGAAKVEDNPNGGGGSNIAATMVPAAVKSSFAKLYPDATRVEWKLKDGQYKVEFYRATVKWQAIFSAAGVLLKQERA